METSSPNERHVQEFRLHSTSNSQRPPSPHGAVGIPARKDTKTGDHVVLLSDIQLVYNNTNHILNDGATVPFVKDDRNQELIPLRIKYHPGVVLEVVEDTKQDKVGVAAVDALLQHTDEHSTTTSTLDAPSVLLTLIKRYGSYFNYSDDMTSSQNSLLQAMRQEISDNSALQERLQNIQQQVDDLRQQAQYDRQQALEEIIVESQEELLTAQQKTIDRLVTIQDS
ncbi:hypothetical protein BGZ65_004081, partial [Modicella reniformis]